MGLVPGSYLLVTLHRPSNVDDPERLSDLMLALGEIVAGTEHPVLLPVHPRTSARIRELELDSLLEPLTILPPLRYLDFLGLMQDAAGVITDSGGIQEETTVLGIPCVTVRPNTERPVTLTHGTNRLFDGDPHGLLDVVREALIDARPTERPPLWDGRAAERIAAITLQLEEKRGAAVPTGY
jgi:UDP-N-acetylglucosamine 2-epimerase (non-hydrolysing)